MKAQDLKNSILQLAIQGKLVEQRKEEGTAKEMLEQIESQKNKLIKEGIIKKEKLLPAINDEEIPYDIPTNWEWVRLGDYCEKITDQVASGSFASLKKNVISYKEPNYAIMVKTADFRNGFSKNLTYTDKHGYCFLNNSNLFGGELILSNIGSIGKCFIVPYLDEKMTLAPNAIMLRLLSNEYRDFLYNFLLSKQGYNQLINITSGTAMKKFNKTDLKKIIIPIPPLEEQKRIVKKIEELIPIVDKYDKAYTEVEVLNKKFPEDMQKSILQYAIQGKLVEQRKEEGTAEELYKQIQEEKKKLIKEGKIKQGKPLPEIKEEEIPFDIPESWEWVKLGNIVSILGDGIHGTPVYDEKGNYYFINGNNLKNGEILLKDNTKKVSKEQFDKHKRLLNGSSVFVSINGTIGNVAFFRGEKIVLGKSACYFNLINEYFKYYIYWVIKSKYFADYANKSATGSTIKNVSLAAMKDFLIPLPPFEEQKRIVDQIEKMLPYCQDLVK